MQTGIPIAHPHVGDTEIAAAVRVLRSGQLVQGEEVAAFESEFSVLVRQRLCVAVSSGTSALYLAVLALGIGVGDEVIVPSFTFGATAHAVALTGASPVFADIDPSTFCLDPRAVESAVTPRTVAVVPVHLFGHPAAMDQIGQIAAKHQLAVIEDAAQAVGASLHGTPVGASGDVACFSFYPTKNMHSIEGGMAATADPALARRLRLLRNQGMEQYPRYEIVGLNARMTDVAAAVGRVQLAGLNQRTRLRRHNAGYLSSSLTGVVTPCVAPGAEHVYHQYTVRVPGDRDAMQARLAAAGITTAIFYPEGVHRSPAHHSDTDLPQTDSAAAEVLSLPVHPALSLNDLQRIVEAVHG